MGSALEIGLYVLIFAAALVYFSRHKQRQRTEDDREDLRSLILRTDRSAEEARRGIRRYVDRTDWLRAEDGDQPLVLVSTPGPLQPGYYFRIRLHENGGDSRGTRLDIGVRSRMPLYFWHPFVDGKIDDLADGLVEELDPAVRVS